MVGDFPVTDQVFGARELVGEHRGDQVLGLHALQRRWDFTAAAEAQHGESPGRVPAPPGPEHRCIEHRLHQQVFGGRGSQVLEDILEREAVLRAEREHDGVLGRRGLQLEVEAAAESFAQRETPRAIDPAAKGRVQHELHPACFVKEPLEHQNLLCGNGTQDLTRGREILHDLPRACFIDPQRLHQPLDRALGIVQAIRHILAQP